jgi:N-acetylglucosamine kinase-like BadF-type ATPase
MDYLLGFDCGATNSESAVADTSGNILHTLVGKPANFLVNGSAEASENILSLIRKCRRKLNFEYDDIKSVVIGAAGAGREEDAAKLKSALLNLASKYGIKIKLLTVIGDAQIALEGAFPNKSGSILIAGTGSIIYGKDEEGKIYRSGGFGRIFGDEGSGYSIGRNALQYVAKYYDGSKEKSDIVSSFIGKYDINSSEELLKKVYRENFDIASVAELVLDSAGRGDKSAITILEDESDELIVQIKTIMKKMKVSKMNISFAGSLILNKNVYSDMLREKIKNSLSGVTIVKAEYPPVQGAINIARKILNA